MGRREWYHKGGSSTTTTGCMSGMLSFFDFHHLLLFTPTNLHESSKTIPSLSHESFPELHSGLEAPRNSLEEINEEEDDYFDILPVGVKINQVATTTAVVKKREKMEFYLEEERKSSSSSSSQAVTPRTPSVVARLMGLDLLPEISSSCSCSSLPVTPITPVITKRMKKKKNVDNVRKPLRNLNCNANGSRSLPDSPRASSSVRKSYDVVEPRLSLQLNKENVLDSKTSSKSSDYAREIVKQVKESIRSNRKDATLGIASDDEFVGIKSRRTRTCERSNKSSKSSSTASSIFSNHNIKFQKPVKPTRSPPPPPPPPPPRLDIKKPNIKPKKYEKKTGYERLTRNIKKNKSKTKETKVNQDFELKYIRSVLEHANLLSGSLMKTHSNSNPIDPVLFHLLELKLPPDQHCTGPFKNRWNRKLLFHLVVEIVGEVIQHGRSFTTDTTMESLFNYIAKQINSYPGANCQVLGDIDALIDGDLPERNVRRLLKHPAVEMEMVEIMEEIEGDIVQELIGEMVMMMT